MENLYNSPGIKGFDGGFYTGSLNQLTPKVQKYPEGFVQNRYGINEIKTLTAAFLG